MPGVNVTNRVRSGPINPLTAPSGQFFVSGLTERGPVGVAVRLRSMLDYSKAFGDRVSYGYLYDSIKSFFEEGGSLCYATRVLGDTPTKGTLTGNLLDRAGTPLATLKVDAKDPGAWSSRVSVAITDGIVTNTFDLTVYLDGTAVEVYRGLTSPANAVTQTVDSTYITLTNMSSVTVAPNNNPAVRSAVTLTAGTDDRGTVVSGDYVTALAAFTDDLGDGAVSIPGQDTAVHSGLADHAKTYNRIAILAGTKGATATALKTAATALNAEHAGLFAPWVLVPDGAGGSLSIPPEGYVAAVRNRAHQDEGPWRAAAGGIAIARYVTGVDQVFDKTTGNDLNDHKVNAIRVIGTTIRVYGWRSLSNDTDNYYMLTGADVVNRATVEGRARLEKYVFRTIDGKGQLLALINAELVGMVAPWATAGGLYALLADDGTEIDPGYGVDTSTAVNPLNSLAQNEANVILSIRVSPTGETINLSIVKVGVTASL